MKSLLSFTLFLLFIVAQPFAQVQPEEITLEGIWRNGDFNPRRVPGFRFMNDGKHYTRKSGNLIVKYDLLSGQSVDTILDVSNINTEEFSGSFNSYTFSADERKILIKAEQEMIYRRSSKAWFYVLDMTSGSVTPVFEEGKIMHCSFSPDGQHVAFVYNNDLYTKDLSKGKTVQITDDGKYNEIINGSADWVYEEEFGFTKAFQWSVDSEKIAYYKFDEARVKEFPMEYFRGGMYPDLVTFKYPKVDELNAIVSVHIYHVSKKKTIDCDVTSEPDGYIPRIKWTASADALCVFKMNRHQNNLKLMRVDAKSGKSSLLLEEENQYYVDITDDLTFFEGGDRFIWSSEKDGYSSLYVYNMRGEEVRRLTGDYDVTAFYGVNESLESVFFQAAKESPLTRQIYSVDLDGQSLREIAVMPGTNSAQFSSTFDYYVLTHSSINTAATYSVYSTKDNALVRTIEDNNRIAEVQESTGTTPVEFFTFENREGVSLNGWMIKPADFNPNRQYPVFMYLYGGPGSQQVVDAWKGSNYWWFQMLASKGYIVACVDNRGTGGRGEEFRKMTYMNLGHHETNDQIDAAKYLGNLTYTDASRIGIFGWSYGGYMSSLCLLKGNDVFKSAIAVAPVTNWKWYDTIYTERYMRGYKENTAGYDDNSPINFADQLKGDYLLVHGIADDNVHWQHTVEMANALISANKQFDTYFYPNRNHGIYGDNARLHLYTKMTNFIERTLGDKLEKSDRS